MAENEKADADSTDAGESGVTVSETAKKRWWAKKIVVVTGLAIAIYLFSYGPTVMNAINQYGRTSDFAETLYTPADWLARHFGLYHDYRLFWAKESRNYPWWMQNSGRETDNPLLPQLNRKPGSKFQPPPEKE